MFFCFVSPLFLSVSFSRIISPCTQYSKIQCVLDPCLAAEKSDHNEIQDLNLSLVSGGELYCGAAHFNL